MSKIAENIIELEVYTRKVTKTGNTNDSILTLKDKFLYLLSKKPMQPFEICDALCISKTNLAHLSALMEKEDLLKKTVKQEDKRQIEYSLTKNGEAHINIILEAIENKFKNILTSAEDYEKAKLKLDEVLELLSFI